MSFLNQLKAEASSLQRQRGEQHVEREQGIAQIERASVLVLHYFEDLARQSNVIGWDIVPQHGAPVNASLSVNFPPDLELVALGPVKHERAEVRHPEKGSLLAFRFDYLTQTRGNVNVTADHETAQLAFRLLNPSGFGIARAAWPADKVSAALRDELAKLVVSQPSRLV